MVGVDHLLLRASDPKESAPNARRDTPRRNKRQGVLYLAVFHTDQPSFDGWRVYVTHREPEKTSSPRSGTSPTEPARTPAFPSHVDDEGWGRGRRPVINISWEDSVAYTRWLSEQTGERYRLPSEAEWEYAARVGTRTKYHFGNDRSRLCEYGNHADRSTDYGWRNSSCSDGVGRRTAIVGMYRPNPYGIHDMNGNVWEWVQDCWNSSHRGAPAEGTARQNGDCSRRVLRGGGWNNNHRYLRSAFRCGYATRYRFRSIGFRVARTVTP